MEKEIYLIGGTANESYPAFRERMLNAAGDVAADLHPAALHITLTETPPPQWSVIPFKKGKIAAVSLLRTESGLPAGRLTGEPGFRSASRVTEALPVAYTPAWPAGTVTPGICLLTLFRKKEGITYEQFLDRWHNSHTPLSLRIHPLWHYNRNVVTETIAAAEIPWGGIVEEHFRNRSDLLNPFRFFGPLHVIIPHMIEVYRDTRSFLDYSTIEPWLVREYILR